MDAGWENGLKQARQEEIRRYGNGKRECTKKTENSLL
jgi:hypothetical protein